MLRQDFTPKPAFSKVLATQFGSEPHAIAKDTGAATAAINEWVSKQTNGKIPELLKENQVTPDTVMVLVNAIYLNALWSIPFDENLTGPMPFQGPSGSTTVQGMSVTDKFAWKQQDGTDVVLLPYTEPNLRAVVVAPKPGGLPALLGSLSTVDALIADAKPTPMKLQLPQFSVRTAKALNETLESLGLTDAFDPERADFSGIGLALVLSFVQHEAWIKVAEKGTEAAAATAGGVEATSAPEGPMLVSIDRPFLFLVEDTQTKAIVFSAVMNDPSQTAD